MHPLSNIGCVCIVMVAPKKARLFQSSGLPKMSYGANIGQLRRVMIVMLNPTRIRRVVGALCVAYLTFAFLIHVIPVIHLDENSFYISDQRSPEENMDLLRKLDGCRCRSVCIYAHSSRIQRLYFAYGGNYVAFFEPTVWQIYRSVKKFYPSFQAFQEDVKVKNISFLQIINHCHID